MRFICDACDRPTTHYRAHDLILCPDCAVEAMLSDAADAINDTDRFDIEYRALCDSFAGHPDMGGWVL